MVRIISHYSSVVLDECIVSVFKALTMVLYAKTNIALSLCWISGLFLPSEW